MLPKVITQDYSKFSESNFVSLIVQLKWESLEGNDLNESPSISYKELTRTVSKHSPTKTISKHKPKQLCKPWISRGLWISSRKKNMFWW